MKFQMKLSNILPSSMRPSWSVPPADLWVVPGGVPDRVEHAAAQKIHKSLITTNNEENFTHSNDYKDNGDAGKTSIVVDHEYSTFHNAMGPVIVLAQFFALLPIRGVLGPSASSIRFCWKSWRVFYAVLTIFCSSIMMVMTIVRLTKIGMDFLNSVGLVFYASTLFTTALFIVMAKQWPTLTMHWARVESEMGPPQESTPLSRKIKRLTVFIMLGALVEHLLSIVSGVVFSKLCSSVKDNVLEAFHRQAFPQIFEYFPYSVWVGVTVQFVNILSTFSWNYMDLFIILISTALSQRFQQINNSLQKVKGKNMPDTFWRACREDYLRLSELLFAVDDVLSRLVMLSFSNNLFFICAQLLKGLCYGFRDASQAVYFWYSFTFLVGRTLGVSLYAASIQEASKVPLLVLRAVPSQGYSIEVQRFTDHVATDSLALTGMKFFSITRGIVLTIAGTIVTYELVLFQFNANEKQATNWCQWTT